MIMRRGDERAHDEREPLFGAGSDDSVIFR
jgi:hypothetical protein